MVSFLCILYGLKNGSLCAINSKQISVRLQDGTAEAEDIYYLVLVAFD